MKHVYKLIATCTLLAILQSTAHAQTAIWQLPPSDYASIEPYATGLFIVAKEGLRGIIRSDGTTLVPPIYDVIAPYYDGKALLIKHQGSANAVGGYLTEDGRYVPFTGNYYVINGIDFYSCGMLAATDAQGRKGYLDESGAPALGFNGAFDQVTPFSEDYAAVFNGKGNNKKYALIDKHGNRAAFRLGLGEVNSGTNVYRGRAVIWDTNGKFYTYDTSSGRCSHFDKPYNTSLDYLYCFSGLTQRTRKVPYTQPTPPMPDGPKPILGAKGLIGYNTDDGHVILPPQFASATAFYGGIAVVTVGTRKGLLRLMPTASSFAVQADKAEYTYENGQTVTCGLHVTIPEVWKPEDVTFTVVDANTGENVNGVQNKNNYTFALKPNTESKTVTVTLAAQDMTLWTGSATFAFRRLEPQPQLAASISIASSIANRNGQVPVTVTISNNGAEDVTTIVHITGSSTLIEKHETVTVPAHNAVHLHTAFTIRNDVSGQYVNVTTSKGGSASRKNLSFETYY